ncbi:hypothetical protein BDK51DRAFT_25809, partial [Blyttiomyces helicus]
TKSAGRVNEVAVLTEKVETLEARTEKLEAEKRDLAGVLARSQADVERVSEESDRNHQRLLVARDELRAANEKLLELDSELMRERHAAATQEQEAGQLKRSNEFLSAELDRKSREFNEYRKEKTAQVATLQRNMEEVTEEKSSAENVAASLRRRSDELEQKLQDLLFKSKETENRLILTEQQFKNEMNSQKKLTDLYEAKAAEGERQVKELETLLSETRADVERIEDENRRLAEEVDAVVKANDALDLENRNLKKDLEEINAGAGGSSDGQVSCGSRNQSKPMEG